jgi:Na+/H+ antiporter NhaB
MRNLIKKVLFTIIFILGSVYVGSMLDNEPIIGVITMLAAVAFYGVGERVGIF